MVFDQNAGLYFDTTLNLDLRPVDRHNEIGFQPAPILSVSHQGVLDYIPTWSDGSKSTTIICLRNDNSIWQYSQLSSFPMNLQLLAADNQYIVNALYTFKRRAHFNDVSTTIQLMTAQGKLLGESVLFKSDSVCIYPIAADIQKNGIEVISEFTSRAHEYSNVKFGICIHRFDFSGSLISSQYNEFTQNLVKDSVMKKYKLLTRSYLYMHKAVMLQNGNWLVAGEQLMRTRLRMNPFFNPPMVYNKKNICLMEIDDHAELVKRHVEPNKPDGVKLPHEYYRRPQNGAIVANAKDRMDISYFIKDDRSAEEKISFVFTDYNYKTRKLSLGNLLYKNGEVKVDRFVIPTFTMFTRIGILPARFGHALLIKYDPLLGLFDFDNIKFNN